tara:strand:- start:106 stop:315 length:210 start_codon:yes stop_codon:yes gene_type:complete
MKIKVNGEDKFINITNREISLADTINHLGYKPNTVVVELNNLIVNFDGWRQEKIKDGDKLEIVSIVGGG